MRTLVLALVLLAGCTPEFREKIRRGEPGSEGYIAPKYADVVVIHAHEGNLTKVGNTTMITKPHTVIEDEQKRRYRVIGIVGEPGDTFSMDVSLLEEMK